MTGVLNVLMKEKLYYTFQFLPNSVVNLLIMTLNLLFHSKEIKKNRSLYKKNRDFLHVSDRKSFKRLANYEFFSTKYADYLNTTINPNIHLISGDPSSLSNNDKLIMMCTVKDDLERIKHQYKTMKSFGIEQFVYIDNGSTDGSKEWLMTKKDIVVYQTHNKFNSVNKSAWYRTVVRQVGFDRWYLFLDSDEIYMYPGIEEDRFQGLIKFINTKGYRVVNSIMLDLYPEKPINLNQESQKNDFDCYNYFDRHYNVGYTKIAKIYHGGPRQRLFGSNAYPFNNWLQKNNLIYYEEDMFHYAHIVAPYAHNFKSQTLAATLHYKFMPNDFDKYRNIADLETYNSGSREYKRYADFFENHDELNFFGPDSTKLNSSMDLLEIDLLDSVDFLIKWPIN